MNARVLSLAALFLLLGCARSREGQKNLCWRIDMNLQSECNRIASDPQKAKAGDRTRCDSLADAMDEAGCPVSEAWQEIPVR